MDFETAKRTVEALLFASEEPLSQDRLVQLLSDRFDSVAVAHDTVGLVLVVLREEYEKRSIELVEVASGFRFHVKPQFNSTIFELWNRRQPRYSRALIETLAMIAYRQPVTRGDIEAVRGVGVSTNIIRTLIDRGWIREVGKKPVPGQPALYGTTPGFLDYFNLKSLGELPPISDIEATVAIATNDAAVEAPAFDTNESGEAPQTQIEEIVDPEVTRLDDE